MNVSLENIDKVSALLTVKIEKADYQEQVDTSLKTIRRKAQLPGFRQGMVPASLIQKMYGKSVVAEEVDKLLSKEINNYISENKIRVLGEPLTNEEKQPEIDFNTMEDFEFVFDIAISPEFTLNVTGKDKVDYYTVDVTDEMLDDQIKTYTQRNGKYEKVDSYQDKDMLKGHIAELDEKGNTKEGGVQVENAVVMPAYMKDDAQKAIFDGAKVNDVLVFNPNKAYEGHEAEIASLLHVDKSVVAGITADFSFQVAEITRFVDGELNQELFDQVFAEGEVRSEEEFRTKIKGLIAAQFTGDCDYKFLLDARQMLAKKVGELEFPEALLKRIIIRNQKDDSEELTDEQFKKSIEELEWHLIKEKLVKDYEIKVEQDDIVDMAKQMTRAQFAQYGMMTVPDDILENYAKEMLGKRENIDGIINRVLEMKLASQLKEKVKLNPKTVSLEEFGKLFN